MGAYCTLDSIRRHPARLGEIIEVRRLFTYYDAAVFGDRDEIASPTRAVCSRSWPPVRPRIPR